MNPLVSIITSTYNLSNYIGACIESVQNQTYPDWEMLIVDDCSSDETVKIIERYRKKDNRIRLITHKKNYGVEELKKTYNEALGIAKGELIAVLEGDDWWPEYKLERQVSDFKDKSVVLSYGDSIFTDKNGIPFQILTYHGDQDRLNNLPVGSILHLFADFNFYLSPVTVMIRAKALHKMGGFQNDPNYYFVDFPTWMHLSYQGTFAYHHAILGYYRRHPGSFWLDFAARSSSMTRIEMQKTFLHILKMHEKNSSISSSHFKKYIIEQNKIIDKKSQNRSRGFLFHHFAYGDPKKAMQFSEEIIKQDPSFVNKLIAVTIKTLLPFRVIVLKVSFMLQYLYYRFSRV